MKRFFDSPFLFAAATPFLLVVALLFSFTLTACEGGDDPDAVEVTADEDAPAAADAPTGKLNLNTATDDEFKAIPNVGDEMAHEFEEYRPYVSIEQFRREIGKYVDADQVTAYEEYVFVPIDINESDAATLQQIPGLTADEAAQVINARPFGSRDAFLAALDAHVSAEEKAVATTYLQD